MKSPIRNTSYPLGGNPKGEVWAYYTPLKENRDQVSMTHPKRNGHYVRGGPWRMVREERTYTPSAKVRAIQFLGNPEHDYVGRFSCDLHGIPVGYDPSFSERNGFRESDFENLFYKGAEAFNKARPAKPDFSLANALYELKDLPGMYRSALGDLIGNIRARQRAKIVAPNGRIRPVSRHSTMSKTGEYFLAVEFGWLPLLNDIRGFVQTMRNAQKSLNQLIRDESRPIHRRVKLSSYDKDDEKHIFDRNPGVPYNDSMQPGLTTYGYGGGSAEANHYWKYSERIWAEGQFRYLLPPGPRDQEWTNRMLQRIYGWRVTPTMVWNAMPWTWLFDWFTGLGDFIEAVSPGVEDRLVADYFYIMRSLTWDRYSQESQFVNVRRGDSISSQKVTASVERHVHEKLRVPGSPFGFGLKDSNLNPKQVAILGALGYSRLP